VGTTLVKVGFHQSHYAHTPAKLGLAICPATRYSYGMKTPKQKISKGKPTGGNLRKWRVSLMRDRAHYIGTLDAPDAKAAEDEAVELFGLDAEQRKRLLILETE
jgi:hypothetical protein